MGIEMCKIAIGDWSDDGHGKFDEVILKSNRSADEVKSLLGRLDEAFPGFSELFADYEQSTIPDLTGEELIEAHPDVKGELEFDSGDCYLVDGVESYVRILLTLFKSLDPDFSGSVVEDAIPTVRPPQGQLGYGLYW